jgi:tripartite-type tricarboxylate transporter receptor subunit TctC
VHSPCVPGYEAYAWDGIGAPRGTPAIEKLNQSIGDILAEPGIRVRLSDFGAEPMPMTPTGLANFVASGTEKWGKVIRISGAKLE